MLKTLRNEGFASIVEVIVASVIFVTASLGIFTTIAMLRTQGGGSVQKLEALYLGKRVIDDLRSQVYGNMWLAAGSPLATGTTYTQTIGAYTISYYTADVAGLQLRKLVMNVTY